MLKMFSRPLTFSCRRSAWHTMMTGTPTIISSSCLPIRVIGHYLTTQRTLYTPSQSPFSSSSSSSLSHSSPPPPPSTNLATLRLHGPDGKGIVAACSNLLDRRGYEIVGTEHWTDRNDNLLFLRIVFDKEPRQHSLSSLHSPSLIPSAKPSTTEQELQIFCQARNLQFHINWRTRRQRVAIMVSKYDHCLWELLLRQEAQELLDCDIVAVLSNHDHLRRVAETFGIPYRVFPITPSNKLEQERLELEYLQQLQADVVVLARYMQVLTPHFVDAYAQKIINIHHSFLPAFSGSRPYHAAHARGVKLIGATAHYVTAMLDEGPIIEQDVINVSHRDGVDGLIRKGRILERNVLVRALQAHLDDRVIVYNNKCVIFGD